ncbi:MAG: bifunctional glutamate N-acetyltransferase/amino-acid acetyltransferase ArgJ [Planctomycetes bacterium]|nr:bifunctional glutamate N-acetyltransferase/amino-acid acetyltransferase ArgJ [Planctomycetota bacterium]
MKRKPSSASGPGITWPRGFSAGGSTCGIKASGKPDLAMIVADAPCAAAGMFTKNKMPGAPVIVGKKHIRSGVARAIVANSGCSNVCTGERGIRDAIEMCKLVSKHAGGVPIDPHEVLPCSTGVIGRYLPMEKIRAGIAALSPALGRGEAFDAAAARAIMTTDLVPKWASRSVKIGGKTVRLAGIAKGSGMIQPNMATMFAFITTDAAIGSAALKAALRAAVEASFNRLSIDHDTSTSDTVLVLASGGAGNKRIEDAKPRAAFQEALTGLCHDLAYQIVKDGEGATKVFRVAVRGAKSQKDADKVGYTITGSPLIKCAVHGGDANWGRLVAAVGRSGAAVRPDRLTIHIGGVCVGRDGKALVHPPARQKKLDALMKAREITFTLDLGMGEARTEWLGCDLSKEYVSINADYTT